MSETTTATATLEAIGARVEEIDLATGQDLVQQFHLLWIGMEAAKFGGFVGEHGDRMTRGVREEIARGSRISAVDSPRSSRRGSAAMLSRPKTRSKSGVVL